MSELHVAITTFISTAKRGNYTKQWMESKHKESNIRHLMDYIDSAAYEELAAKCPIKIIWTDKQPDWLATFVKLTQAQQERFVEPTQCHMCPICETRVDEKDDVMVRGSDVIHRACASSVVKPPGETAWALIVAAFDAMSLCSKKVKGYRSQLFAERSKIMTIVDPMVSKMSDAT